MVYSFTAPSIDEKEEKEEYDALSEEEKIDIRNRIHGGFELSDAQNDVMEQAPVLLQEAVDLIPDREKAAYLEAMQQAPELVEQESVPLAFMRAERFNAWAAARRLVEYWKLRRLLFGETRAFLPMTIAGAMAADLGVLRLGVVYRLPDDEHGRPVLFWDRIRSIPPAAPRDSVLRVLFYVMHLICQDEAAQKKGLVTISNMKGYDISTHFDRTFLRRVTKMSNDCMPTFVCAAHMCCGPGKSVTKLILPVIKHIAGKYLRMHMLLHAESDGLILQSLETYGFKRDNVPRVVGGKYSQEDFESWLAEIQNAEQQAN